MVKNIDVETAPLGHLALVLSNELQNLKNQISTTVFAFSKQNMSSSVLIQRPQHGSSKSAKLVSMCKVLLPFLDFYAVFSDFSSFILAAKNI